MDRRIILKSLLWGPILGQLASHAAIAGSHDMTVSPMEDDRFWSLIELIQGDGWHDDRTDLQPLTDALATYPPQDIEAFYETLARKLYALDTRAHYRRFASSPGLSDTFLYTRLAVVAQGKAHYDKVINDPSVFPKRSAEWLEGLLYVAPDAYATATGTELEYLTSVDFESF
ncbi:MAG: DUF4240 domain-containing protein, partial [Pseudomonadota bacterium]